MKQLTIRKRLFLLVGIISTCMLLVQCPKTCNHSTPSPTQSQKSTKQKKAKKDLLRVRQSISRSAVSYVEIAIQPPTMGTTPSQYALTAKTLVGEGDLLVAKEKVKGKLQYTVRLTKETSLANIYLNNSNIESLKQGKSIRLKAMYQPKAGAQLGEAYKASISACAYDSDHHVVDQKSVEISLVVTQAPKTEKSSTRSSKQGKQSRKKGKTGSSQDKFT